jgi:hypothetical protein
VGSTNVGTTAPLTTAAPLTTTTPLVGLEEALLEDLSHVPAQIEAFEAKMEKVEEEEEAGHKYRQQGLRYTATRFFIFERLFCLTKFLIVYVK